MSAFVTPIALYRADQDNPSTSRCLRPTNNLPTANTRRHRATTASTTHVRFVANMSSSSAAASTSAATATAGTGETKPLVVMVNGLPGRMAAATAEEVLRRGLTLADEAMTGAGMSPVMNVSCDADNDKSGSSFGGKLSKNVALQPPSEHGKSLERMRSKYDRLIVVDYTHPKSANANVELYAANGLSFVVGTTGADVQRMKDAVMKSPFSDTYAVIAPNMGKQIVAFQAMMKHMGEQFPGVFSGYTLTVTESHQSTKADTSGTAKAVVESLSAMGVNRFANEDIRKVRTKEESMSVMNVPEQHIDSGHAFHTYHLSSPDNSVHFEFQHNVCGRGVYAAGTVDAVQFLDVRKRRSAAEKETGTIKGQHGEGDDEQRVFNMIDILQSGSMS